MLGLAHISLGAGSQPVALDALEQSHGVAPRAARMYTRFFGQSEVLLTPDKHAAMLLETLRTLVRDRPDLPTMDGVATYTKTQTHNTPAETAWLRDVFDQAGLHRWDVTTVSMTNCASALAAVHGFSDQNRPLLVLAGEKAFHSTGNRLSVGLLGEAPAAALFLPGAGRRVRNSRVEHLPRFFRNPDDMAEDDRRALQGDFEAGFVRFLETCIAQDPDFFSKDPVFVPYNLNAPLVERVLTGLGKQHLLLPGYSGTFGHTFCSDTFLNLAQSPIPASSPVFLFCAGMGVTYAAVSLDADLHETQPLGLKTESLQ